MKIKYLKRFIGTMIFMVLPLMAQAANHSAWSGFFTLPGFGSAVEKSKPVPVQVTGIKALPNPFNPSVRICIEGANVDPVKIEGGSLEVVVFDITGHCIVNLTSQVRKGEVVWDAAGAASGVYLVKVTSGNRTFTKTIELIK